MSSEERVMAMENPKTSVACQNSLECFDLVVQDISVMEPSADISCLRSQQIGSVDSICENLEAWLGRWDQNGCAQFLIIANGSAVETMGRYKRMRRWFPEPVVEHRVQFCNEIIKILTTTVVKLKWQR